MLTSTLPDAMQVLAHPVRSRIVRLLADEQLCTCHLTTALSAKQPLVSYHLKVLRDAGIVDTEACGRFTYYRLREQALSQLAQELMGMAARAESAPKRPCP